MTKKKKEIVHVVMKCAECGDMFEHTTNRKRLFCGPACSMRNQNRRYYERRKERAAANG